ncbi:MAG: hypothetical protein ABW223_12110, partial [Rariglobus sp.]
TNLAASLTLGAFTAGFSGGSFALRLKNNGTIALNATASTLVLSGGGFASATANSMTVAYNTTGAAISESITLAGLTQSLAVDAGTSASPFYAFSALGVTAQLAGLIGITGDFAFARTTSANGTALVRVAVANFGATLGDGTTTYLTLSAGSGVMLVNGTGSAGRITVTATLANVPGVSMAPSTFTLEYNTLADAVAETVTIGGISSTLDLPAGKFVRVTADPISLTIAGISMTGRVAFEQSTNTAGAKVTIISLADINIAAFTGEGSGGGAGVAINNARGLFVITSAGTAGTLAFQADAGFGSFSAGAELGLEINNTGAAVTASGPFGSINLEAGVYTRIVVNNLSIVLPGVTISGDFSFKTALIDGIATQVIVGNNVRVFIGNGDGTVGFELTNGSAVFIRTNGTTEVGFVKGRVRVIGISGVTLDATLTIRLNESGSAYNEVFTLDGEQVAINFTDSEVASGGVAFAQILATNATIELGGVIRLLGEILFTRDATGFTFSATSASLFPGQSYGVSVSDGSDADTVGVKGTLTLATKAFTLNLDHFELRVGDALTVTATNVAAVYDPTNVSASQVLATISTATFTSSLFSGLGTATLNGIIIRRNGFSLGSGHLAPSGGNVSIGSFLTLSGFAINVANLNVTYGTSTVVTGTLSATASGLSLFPAGGFLQTKATGIVTTFDFGTGRWTLNVASFELTIASAIRLTATNVAINPGATGVSAVIATIASATLGAAQFQGLETIQITNIQIRKDGFSLGSFTLNTPTSALAAFNDVFGSLVKIDSLSVTVTNLNVTVGATTVIAGNIDLNARGLVLFPDLPAFRVEIGDVLGLYDLSFPNLLKFRIPAFTFRIGDLLAIDLPTFDFSPGLDVMAVFNNIGFRVPSIPDLKGIIPIFTLGKNLIEIPNIDLTIAGPIDLGGFATIGGVNLKVTGFSINRQLGQVLGSVSLTIGQFSLFPNGNFFTTSFTGLAANFDFSSLTASGSFSLHFDTLDLGFGEAFKLSATNFNLTPGKPILATLASMSMTFPQFPALPTVTLNNFVLRTTGFSIDSVNLNVAGSAAFGDAFGSIFSFTGLGLTLSNFSYTYGATPVVLGTITVRLEGARLFPSFTFLDTSLTSLTAFYDLSAAASLKINVTGLRLSVGEALRLEFAPFTITPGLAIMATLPSVTVTSPVFGALTGTITNFVLRRTGFSIDSLTLNAAGPVTIGNFISFSGLQLEVINFRLDRSATTQISGNVNLRVASLGLFPGSSVITTTAVNITAAFDLASPAALGGLTLTVGGLEITVANALRLSATNIVIDPNAPDILATISSATISLLVLEGVQVNASNIAIRRSGFSIGTATLSNLSVNIAGVLTVSSLSATLNNFNYTHGATPTLTGTLALTAGGGSIALGSVLTASLSDSNGDTFALTGNYNFATRVFALTIDRASLSIPGFLTATLNGASFIYNPEGSATQELLYVNEIDVALIPLNNVNAKIQGLRIRKNGFSIDSASGSIGDVSLGSLLTIEAPTVSLTNVNYITGGTLTGQLGLSSGDIDFALGSALTIGVASFTGGYDLGTGRFTLNFGATTISVGGFVTLNAVGVAVIYDPTATTPVLVLGATGVTGSITSDSATLSNGEFILVTYGSGLYTLQASADAAVSVGGSAGVSGRVTVLANNVEEDSVGKSITIGSRTLTVSVSTNGTSVSVQGLRIGISDALTLTGDFTYSTVTESFGIYTYRRATVSNGQLELRAGSALLVVTGVNGFLLTGTDGTVGQIGRLRVGGIALTGVPGITLGATDTVFEFNTTNRSFSETLTSATAAFFSYSVTDDVVTVFTSTSHALTVGSQITITGNGALNGTYTVTETLTDTMFSFAKDMDDTASTQMTGGTYSEQVTLNYSTPELRDFKRLRTTAQFGITLGGITGTLSGTATIQLSTLPFNGVNATVFALGLSGGTFSIFTGETGPNLLLAGINGAFLITPAGTAGTLSVSSIRVYGAMDPQLADPYLDIPGITLAANNVTLGFNTTGAAASATVNGVSFAYTAADKFNFLSVSGTMTVGLTVGATSLSLVGTVGITSQTVVSNGISVATLLISVSSASADFVDGTVKLALRDINGALFTGPSGVAAVLSVGLVSLTGVTGVEIVATNTAVAINTTGADLNVSLPGGDLIFSGESEHNFLAVRTTLSVVLGTASVNASLFGTFAFTKISVTTGTVTETFLILEAIDAGTVLSTGPPGTGVTLSFTGITGAIVVRSVGLAGSITVGSAALTGVTGLTLDLSAVKLDFNTTGADIIANLGSTSFSFTGASKRDFFAVTGTANIGFQVSGFAAALSGTFTFERSTTRVNGVNGTPVIKLSVTSGATSITASGVTLAVTGINGALLLTSAGLAGRLTVGGIALTGITGVTLNVSALTFDINTTGADASATVGSTTFAFTGADKRDFMAISGTVGIGVSVGSVAVTLTGTFSFQRSILTVNGTSTPLILITASNVSTSITATGVTLSLTGLSGILVVNTDGLAGDFTIGGISLTGVTGVTVSVTTGFLQFNNTGRAISATSDVRSFAFTAASQHQFFAIGGYLTFNLTTPIGAVALVGGFSIERTVTTINSIPNSVLQVTIQDAATSILAGTASAGARVTAAGIRGVFLIRNDGVVGFLRIGAIAITQADGSAIPGVDISASNAVIGLNTTGVGIKSTIGYYYFDYTAAQHRNFFAISADLAITLSAGPVAFQLNGRFGITKVEITALGVTTGAFLISVIDTSTSITVGSAPGGAKLTLSGITGAFVVASIGGKTSAAGGFKIGGIALTEADGVTPLVGNLSFVPLNFSFNFNLFVVPFTLNIPSISVSFGLFPYIDLNLPGLPSIGLPNFSLPTISLPGITLPTFDLASFNLPAINLPNFSLPSLSLPDFGAFLPSFNLPTISLPSISLPSLSFPTFDFSLPSLNLNLDFSLPGLTNFFGLSGILNFSIGDFVTFGGNFKFKKIGDEIVIVATQVTAALTLGDFNVALSAGTLALLVRADRTFAVDASGTFSLSGAGFANVSAQSVRVQYNTTGVNYASTPRTLTVDGVSATLHAAAGTRAAPFVAFSAIGMQADLLGLVRVAGDFSFSKGFSTTGASIVKVAVANFSTSLGDGTRTYVNVTNGSGALLITTAGVAAQFTATASISGIPGLSLNPSTFTVSLNNTNAVVNETFAIGTTSYTLNLRAGPFIRVFATPLSISLFGLNLTGDFGFEQVRTAAGQTTTILSAANVSLSFNGDGTGGSPISITGARGLLVLSNAGIAGTLSFTANATVGPIQAGGTMKLEINNTNAPVSVTGVFGTVTLDAGVYKRIAVNDLTISFPGIEIEGDFSFTTATLPGGASTQVIVGNNVRIFVGDNVGGSGIGLEMVDGRAVFIKTANNLKVGYVTGKVTLKGVNGLVITAIMTLRINESGGAVNQTFTLDGETVNLNFSASEIAENGISFIQFSAINSRFSIVDIFEFYGDLVFTRTAGQFTVIAANATIFLGSGPYKNSDGSLNPNAIGLKITDIVLGLVIDTTASGKYAIAGFGTVGFAGLSGLSAIIDSAAPRFGFAINKLGASTNKTVKLTSTTAIQLQFTETTASAGFTYTTVVESGVTINKLVVNRAGDGPIFSGSLTIGYPDVFTLSGTIQVQPLPGGVINIIIPEASLVIGSTASPTFTITGRAAFRISQLEGFRMQEFRIKEASVLGESLGALTNAINNLTKRPLTAELADPFNNGVINRATLNSRGYIDVIFNDDNGVGLNHSSITDAGAEFVIYRNGTIDAGITVNGIATRLSGNTYRYTFTGSFSVDAEYMVVFANGSWTDASTVPNTNLAFIQKFVAFDPNGTVTLNGATTNPTGQLNAPPGAKLASLVTGVAVNPNVLNKQGYIDVTFYSRNGEAINLTTINGGEITLSGTGVRDAQVAASAPVHLYGTTYRYYLVDSTPANTTALFGDGEVKVTYVANSFSTVASANTPAASNIASSDTIILSAASSAAANSTRTINIGPISLENPSISIADFAFVDGKIVLTIALNLSTAALRFGGSGGASAQTTSGVTAVLSAVNVTFDLAVGLPGNFSLSTTGKFSVSVGSLTIDVPNVLEVKATGIRIAYDPKGAADQELVRINQASIKITAIQGVGLEGQLNSYRDPSNPSGPLLPGLVVRGNGFTIGEAQIIYSQSTKIKLGSILEFDDLRVGVTNFSVNFSGDILPTFNGTIFIATGGATLFPTSTLFTARAKSSTPGGAALRIDLSFSQGRVNGLIFQGSILEIELAGLLVLRATNFLIDTRAPGDRGLWDHDRNANTAPIAYTDATAAIAVFGSASVDVTIGTLTLGGEARNFWITYGGAFKTGNPDISKPQTFGVSIRVGGADGAAFKWPSWMPIKIYSIGLEWANIETAPGDFDLILSASIDANYGGLKFAGSVDGIRIRPKLLLDGAFPIVGIDGFGVSVTGAGITGSLIGGILQIRDNNGVHEVAPTGYTGAVVDRVFFLGVEGGIEMGTGTASIRFALSELGPLGVFISAPIPILLEPNTGLTITDFAAGVEFFKTLPSIDDPLALRDPAFNVTGVTSPADWLVTVKSQVFAQYLAVKANPAMGGFGAAFTAPMLIKGSAKVYTTYTSQYVFNGVVSIIISTDGKVLISGQLNFAGGALSVSGKLYADLSKISTGAATVLFLADIPDQVNLLTIDGKLQMGFRDATGAEVEIPVVNLPVATPTPTTVSVMYPSSDRGDVGLLNLIKSANGKYYIDVVYSAGTLRVLDYESILDTAPEFTAILNGVNGTTLPLTFLAPKAIVLTTDPTTGAPVETVLTAASTNELLALLKANGVQRFRYEIDTAGFVWAPGTVTVTFAANAWSQRGTGLNSAVVEANVAVTKTFSIHGATVALSTPANGGSVSIRDLLTRGYIDVTFAPSLIAGASILFNAPPVPILAGAGLGTATISGSGVRQGTSNTYRYTITGAFAPGEVTLAFAANSFIDSKGAGNVATTLRFTVEGSTAAFATIKPGEVLGLGSFTNSAQRYIDITFAPGLGSSLDAVSILDESPELRLVFADGTEAVFTAVTLVEGNTYRYTFSTAPVAGAVTLTVIGGSFQDNQNTLNIEESYFFTLARPTVNPGAGTLPPGYVVDLGDLNNTSGIYYATPSTGPPSRFIELVIDPALAGGTIDLATLQNALSISVVTQKRLTIYGNAFDADTNLITLNAHGYADGAIITFAAFNASEAPGGLVSGAQYFVELISANTFRLRSAVVNSENQVVAGSTVDITGSILAAAKFQIISNSAPSTGYTVTGVEQVEDADGNLTNRFRFFYTGNFALNRLDETLLVTMTMAEGAFSDTAGNTSAAFTSSFTVRRAATSFFISLSGGLTLNSGGLLPEPILEIRGAILFQAIETPAGGPRLQLDFNGTFSVIYLGTLGSVTGRFVLDTSYPVDGDDERLPDPEAVTVRELLQEMGVPSAVLNAANLDSALDTELPKLWGVIKLQVNLEFLKNIGLDVQLAGTFQINTTKVTKIEEITLVGSPGNSIFGGTALGDGSHVSSLNSGTISTFFNTIFTGNLTLGAGATVTVVRTGTYWIVNDTANGRTYSIVATQAETSPGVYAVFFEVRQEFVATDAEIGTLNGNSLPASIAALFTGTNALGAGYVVATLIPGTLWRINDVLNKRQFFVEYADVGNIKSTTASTAKRFIIRGETQTFVLASKTLLIAGFAYVKFTINGQEQFSIGGAMAYKLTTNSSEFFLDGYINFTPGGIRIFQARAQAVVISRPDGFATSIILGASLQMPGIQFGGNLTLKANTYGKEIVYEVPVFLRAAVGYSTVTISGKPQELNTDFNPLADYGDPTNIPSAMRDKTGAAFAPYFAIAGIVYARILDAIELDGAFFIGLSTTGGLEVYAAIATELKIPTTDIVLFKLYGTLSLVVDAQGAAGSALLQIDANTPSGMPVGFDFDAEFQLELNTALTARTISVYTYDSGQTRSLNKSEKLLAGGYFHFSAAGTLAFTLGDARAVELKGSFTFIRSLSVNGSVVEGYQQVEMSVSASVADVTLGEAIGGYRIGARLDVASGSIKAYIAAFIQIQVGTGGPNPTPGGQSEITNDTFAIQFRLAFFINTWSEDIVIGGVTLVAEQLLLEASGFIQIHLGGPNGAGFRIEGAMQVIVDGRGFSITVSGSIVARVAGVTVFRGNVIGGLKVIDAADYGTEEDPIEDVDPIFQLAGTLTVTLDSQSILNGNGFTFGASFTFQVNTTNEVQVFGTGPNAVTLEAGIYARVAADGYLALGAGVPTGSNYTGLYLQGSFLLEVGSNGLLVTASATLYFKVSGSSLFNVAADGFLLINQNGIAANIKLSFNVSGTGFAFTATAVLMLNTMGEQITVRVRDGPGANNWHNMTVAKGPYFKVQVTGYIMLAGVAKLDGSFTLTIDSEGLAMEVLASLQTPIGQVAVGGSIYIVSAGIAGSLTATFGAGVGFAGLSFNGTFSIAVNTTSTARTIKVLNVNRTTGAVNGLRDASIAATTVIISFGGSLEVGPFTIRGGVTLKITSNGMDLVFDAFISLGLLGSLDVT